MNTAFQTPAVTDLADRFRCEADVPDPPRDAAGRKQYWEDTVAEAVAELRRRLASTRDEKSFQALQMIVDLEKTRIRHKAPVAGTEVSGGGYSSPLPPMAEKPEPEASATVLASRDREEAAGFPGEPGPQGPWVVRNPETRGPCGPGSPTLHVDPDTYP